MSDYDTILAAKTVLDIPTGTQEWLETPDDIRQFEIMAYEYSNCVRLYFPCDHTFTTMSLRELQEAVWNA